MISYTPRKKYIGLEKLRLPIHFQRFVISGFCCLGVSHLYASRTSKNPGPLDRDSVKNEEDTSPKAVSVTVDHTKVCII